MRVVSLVKIKSMGFKGTKGKWCIDTLNTLSIIDDSGNIFNQLIAQTNGKGREEALANAKLIACAPELLEMLIKANNMCDKMQFPTENELREFAKESLELIKRATE